MTNSNDLTFSGGNEKGNYYLNFNYLSQEGIQKKTGYDRYSVRYNINNTVLPFLTIGFNSTLSYNIQDFSGTAEQPYETNGLAYSLSPLLPVKNVQGDYVLTYPYGNPYLSGQPIPNPVASTEFNINRMVSYRGLASGYAELSFLKNFKLKTFLGVDYMFSNTKQKVDPRINDAINLAGGGTVAENNLTRTSYITTNTLRFDKNLGSGHTVNILVGQEAQSFVNKTVYAAGTTLTSPFFDEISNASTRTSTSAFNKENLYSLFSQACYGYQNKYLVSLSARRDGSSKFGEKNRYGNYWSTGVGWVISQENFAKNATWLNYAKLRGSIGTSGNANSINQNTRFDILNIVNYGGTSPATAGVQQTSLGNADIEWEKTLNLDAGFELRFLREQLGLSVDIYQRRISNLLYTVPLPGLAGFTTIVDNYGKMENSGIEISLSADVIKTKNFQWNLNANWSTNKNRLTKANPDVITTTTSINKVGENFGSFYLRKWAGVSSTDGKPMWIDSLGKQNTDYRVAKQEIVGKPQPDGFGGITSTFRYKSLELSLFFYYQYGFDIYDANLTTLLNDGWNLPYINQASSALDRWQKPGDVAANPVRVLNNPNRGNIPSTRYLFDGSYIRFSNAYLSYILPAPLTNKMKLSFVKLYIQANNLASWSKYPSIDPGGVKNDGSTGFSYPNQRSYSIGINVTL